MGGRLENLVAENAQASCVVQRMRLEVMERADFKCERYGCDYPSG